MRSISFEHILLGTLIVSALLTNTASAEEGGPDCFRVTGVAAGDTLNIHTQPHVKSRIVGEIARETDNIKNLGCKGGLSFNEYSTLSKAEREKIKKERPRWCKIAFDGVEGWVYGRYLTESGCTR